MTKTKRRTRTRTRRQRGGQQALDSVSSWFSGLTSGVSKYFSKDQAQEELQQQQAMLSQSTNDNNLPPVTMPLRAATVNGGRKKRRVRRMRGGYTANESLYAADAAPYSGEKTAQPQVWVGGKTRRKRKSRKH